MSFTSCRHAAATCLLLSLLSPTLASANNQSTTPPSTPSTATDHYNSDIANLLPVIGMGASIVVMTIPIIEEDGDVELSLLGALSLTLTPSLGRMYIGDWEGALLGTGLRLSGAVMALFSVTHPQLLGGNEAALAVGGLGVWAGSILYDLITMPSAVRKANRGARKLALVPGPMMGPKQSMGWGALVRMRF